MLVTATMAVSAVVSLPIAATALPTEAPSPEAVASLFALGVLGTGIAFVFFYDLIDDAGAAEGVAGGLHRARASRCSTAWCCWARTWAWPRFAGLVLILLGSYLAAYERLPFVRPSPPADHKPRRYRAPA